MSLRLSRFSTVTSFPFVISLSTLRIIALRVAFVFLAIHLLMYAMMLDAVSSSNSAVILRIPPFFFTLYSIGKNSGSSISGKSAASSTLSNGVDSASTCSDVLRNCHADSDLSLTSCGCVGCECILVHLDVCLVCLFVQESGFDNVDK